MTKPSEGVSRHPVQVPFAGTTESELYLGWERASIWQLRGSQGREASIWMTVMEYIKKSKHLCKTLDTSLSSYFAPTTQSTPNKSKPQCQICGKLGHKANICYHRTNLNYQPTQHPPKYFIFFFLQKLRPLILQCSTWCLATLQLQTLWLIISGT